MKPIALTEQPTPGRVADLVEMISIPVVRPADDEVIVIPPTIGETGSWQSSISKR